MTQTATAQITIRNAQFNNKSVDTVKKVSEQFQELLRRLNLHFTIVENECKVVFVNIHSIYIGTSNKRQIISFIEKTVKSISSITFDFPAHWWNIVKYQNQQS